MTEGRRWRHPWVRRGVLVLCCAVPPLVFLRHLLPHPTYLGTLGDIRAFHFWWEVSRHTVLEFGQLPFWNPYYCGGMVHWANVQTMFLHPSFLVNLAFGPGVGIRVHIVAHFIAGFTGAWVLSRHLGLRGLWAFAPGVVFVFGANLAERATGHLGFMPFLLLPWLAYFYERAKGDLRYRIAAAAMIAYPVYAGGPYPFVMFAVYVTILTAFDSARGAWRARTLRATLPHLQGLFITLGVGVAFAALKLGPVIDFFSEYPRLQNERDTLAPWQVWEVFMEEPLVRHRKGYTYVFGEYRNYLGPAVMVALPAVFLRPSLAWRDLFVVAVAGSLMLGHFSDYSPYALLSELPVFRSLRVPVRYALLCDLHIGLIFGRVLQGGVDATRRTPVVLRMLVGALMAAWFAVAAVDLMTNNNTQLRHFFADPGHVEPRAGSFRMVHGSPHDVYQAPSRNEGHLRCYEPNPIPTVPGLRAFASHEAYYEDGGAPELLRWSPNDLVWRTDTTRPRRVLINMNYHRDWSSNLGRVHNVRGQLAVDVPPGRHEVQLRYQPRRLLFYGAVSLAAWLACGIALWLRARRRARAVERARYRGGDAPETTPAR